MNSSHRNNSNILRHILFAGTTLSALTVVGAPSQNEADASRPNIIFFLVDDMGWQDTSVPFWTDSTKWNRMYNTPNMERLAARGMKFTQAYACPISSPSRVSLLTGANAARHRVTNWTLSRDNNVDDPSSTVSTEGWNVNGASRTPGVPLTYVSPGFVDELRQAGYHTIHCGKAHFGSLDTPGENPHHWGFETNIAGHAAGGLATYLSEKNYGHRDDGTPYALNAIPGLEKYWKTGTFATEALTQEAIKALDKSKNYNQPFFLYMAHYAVHIPIDRDMRFYPKYIDLGLSPKEAAYASLVEGMDKSLGDLMDWVDSNGLTDNTVIVFMSDNGGLATQSEWRDGELYTQNSPLLCGKGSLHEGGIRVPMIVDWPGVTKPGSVNDTPIIIEDWNPTLLTIGQAERTDTSARVDGVDFTPLLRNESMPELTSRPIVWNFPNIWGNDGPGINLNCAVRQGPWKLIYWYETGKKSLYNIENDISETTDLADDYPEIVKDLSATLGNLLRERNATRPIFKATGKPCPWPDEK